MHYKVYLICAFLFPLGVFFFIGSQVYEIQKNLVEISGTISVSKKISRGARSDTKYYQKMDDYKVAFVNDFFGLGRTIIPNKLAKIYQDPEVREIPIVYWSNPRLKEEAQRKGSLFIFKHDLPNLKKDTELNYFYVRLNGEEFSFYTFYNGILQYVINEQIGAVLLFLLIFINLGLFISAAPGYEKPEDKWVFKWCLRIMAFYVLIFLY